MKNREQVWYLHFDLTLASLPDKPLWQKSSSSHQTFSTGKGERGVGRWKWAAGHERCVLLPNKPVFAL